MDHALRSRLNKILALASRQDWRDRSFSLGKAHICAELSAIVYEDVQEYELKKASRIHLFASDTYRQIIKSGKANTILSALVEERMEGRFFVVRGRYAVILGTMIKDVVILAIRGTVFRKLWDWKANVDSKKYHFSEARGCHHSFDFANPEDQFFHRGFFESIVPHFGSIAEEIEKRTTEDTELTIVWTGHSLGGAMAAIGNAVSESRIGRERPWSKLSYDTSGAYTFGMPRYCGLGAVCCFKGPHHIYKQQDLVPTLPLRSMGFSDCSREYELTDSGVVALTERTDAFGLAGHVPKLLSSISAHSIEGYATSLAKAVGLPRPT